MEETPEANESRALYSKRISVLQRLSEVASSMTPQSPIVLSGKYASHWLAQLWRQVDKDGQVPFPLMLQIDLPRAECEAMLEEHFPRIKEHDLHDPQSGLSPNAFMLLLCESTRGDERVVDESFIFPQEIDDDVSQALKNGRASLFLLNASNTSTVQTERNPRLVHNNERSNEAQLTLRDIELDDVAEQTPDGQVKLVRRSLRRVGKAQNGMDYLESH